MAGTAVVAGTAAASARLGRSGDKLRPALETESGYFFAHLAAVAVGTLDFGFIVEDDLLEILVAFGAVEFKNRHSRSPFLANYNKGKGRKAIVNPFNDAMSQGTGRIPVLNFSGGCWLPVADCSFNAGDPPVQLGMRNDQRLTRYE
jgi:hypothetical protein